MVLMITLKQKLLPYLNRNIVWFEQLPNKFKFLSTVYRQSAAKHNMFGYKRVDFYTKLIDLNKNESEILAGFDKDTSYEIRRAKKDKIYAGTEEDLFSFINFYNKFALTKKLKPIGESIFRYQEHLIVTKAVLDDETLVMHSYLLDDTAKRVRLLHSASLFRLENFDTNKKAVVGRANRFLHAEDMLLFKIHGYKIYDMGGYAFETEDLPLLRINNFKDGFGGELVLESDYWPRTFLLALDLLALGKKIKDSLS